MTKRYIAGITFYNPFASENQTWQLVVEVENEQLARDKVYTDMARLVDKENISEITIWRN